MFSSSKISHGITVYVITYMYKKIMSSIKYIHWDVFDMFLPCRSLSDPSNSDVKHRFWLPYDFPPVVDMVVT